MDETFLAIDGQNTDEQSRSHRLHVIFKHSIHHGTSKGALGREYRRRFVLNLELKPTSHLALSAERSMS